MQIVKMPEGAENVISYEITKNTISFNDDELALNLQKRERDGAVHIDICTDRSGALVMGAENGFKYVAQIDIPAREYTEAEVEAEEGTEEAEGMETRAKTVREPVPFSMDRCTLTLWEMEE
jgi:hypothetical protein